MILVTKIEIRGSNQDINNILLTGNYEDYSENFYRFLYINLLQHLFN